MKITSRLCAPAVISHRRCIHALRQGNWEGRCASCRHAGVGVTDSVCAPSVPTPGLVAWRTAARAPCRPSVVVQRADGGSRQIKLPSCEQTNQWTHRSAVGWPWFIWTWPRLDDPIRSGRCLLVAIGFATAASP